MEEFRIKVKQNCCFLPKLVFRYLGVSVSSNDTITYKLYSLFVLFISSTYPVNNIFLMLQNLDDFDIMTNSLFNIIGAFAALLKMMVIVFNRRRVEHIFAEIEKIQKERNTEKWGQAKAYRTNKMTIGCLLVLHVSLICFFISTIAGRMLNSDYHKWSLPISDVSFINKTYSPNYEIAWVYQAITVFELATSFCLTDFLVASVITDMCIQLKIMQHRIKEDINRNSVAMNEMVCATDVAWNNLHKTLKDIVLHHISLIELADEIEDVFNLLVFADVLGSTLMIGFSVYCGSVLPLFDFKALQVYLEVFAVTSSLFFLCFWGSAISIESQAVADACYEANFVGLDVRFQRGLKLVMMRSQKPMKISVGKFTTLSISIFVWIMRNSYTYFMVLSKGNENQNNYG